MANSILELSDVNSFYDQLQVLRGVSIKIEEGSVSGLVGPNGAGKSTLLKTMIGMVRHSGTIRLGERGIDGLSPKEIVELGVVYVPEGRRVFPDLTVSENLDLGAMSSRAKAEKQANLKLSFEVFPLLKERGHQLAGTLSGGELQLLAIARGLMGAPKVLLVDEPSLGLSPVAINLVFETLKKINELGMTVFIVEQNVPRLLHLASFAYVLENGSIVGSGTSQSLKEDERFARSYLGI